MRQSLTDDPLPLTPQTFHILLALARRPFHGYGIVQDCEADSGGLVLAWETARLHRAAELADTRLATKPPDDTAAGLIANLY